MSKEEYIQIEDALCQAFVLTLGTKIPEKRCLQNMISWIKLRSEKEQKPLSEQFIYHSIPLYIDFLFSKS